MRCYNEDLENHQEFCRAGKMLQPMSVERAFPRCQSSMFETTSKTVNSARIAATGFTTGEHKDASRRTKKSTGEKLLEFKDTSGGKSSKCFRTGMSNLRVEDGKECSNRVMCDSPKRKKRREAERVKVDKVSDQRRRVSKGGKLYRLKADGSGFAGTTSERITRQDKKLAKALSESKVAPDAPRGSQRPPRDSQSGALKRHVPTKSVGSETTFRVASRGPECHSSMVQVRAASSIAKLPKKPKRPKSSAHVDSASKHATMLFDSPASDLSKSSPTRRCHEPAAFETSRFFWKDPALSRPTTPKGILKKSSSRELSDSVANPIQLDYPTRLHPTTKCSDRCNGEIESRL